MGGGDSYEGMTVSCRGVFINGVEVAPDFVGQPHDNTVAATDEETTLDKADEHTDTSVTVNEVTPDIVGQCHDNTVTATDEETTFDKTDEHTDTSVTIKEEDTAFDQTTQLSGTTYTANSINPTSHQTSHPQRVKLEEVIATASTLKAAFPGGSITGMNGVNVMTFGQASQESSFKTGRSFAKAADSSGRGETIVGRNFNWGDVHGLSLMNCNINVRLSRKFFFMGITF